MLYRKIFLFILVLSCVLFYSFKEKNDKKWTHKFDVKKENLKDTGGNPYFILKPGYRLVLKGREGNKEIELRITVLYETKMINDIKTRVVEEREFHNGKLKEISRNYFVIDEVTNSIFYFGEDVDIYENGKIVSHEGSWHSGEKGARFGLMMPGLPLLGARYYEEVAPDIAMDRAEIISVDEEIETPAGKFKDCLRIEETTPLEPYVKEYKIYAPGIGLVKDGNLKLVKHFYVRF